MSPRLGLVPGKRGGQRQWWLDAAGLDAGQARAWRQFLAAVARVMELDARVLEFSGAPPEDGAAFAFVSDSAALSRKLLWNVPRLYVAPQTAPDAVDPWLQWRLTATTRRDAYTESLTERQHWTSVISSVFRADEFLPGFLRNCSQWQGYAQVEHFLIRPNSPGKEHAALVDHVRQWPSAIYLQLPRDPGLYAVWNLGAQLATGEFLSNANLDDRRDPKQLARLTAALRAHPEMAAAAAALRVSQTPGMDWEASGPCPTMFADLADGVYGGADLLRHKDGALVSRNFLHCMPVWRRGLHARFGFFDEAGYGPSADWEFWLRCAAGGARFGFVSQPLGLYLRDSRSYWRRDPRAATADRSIIQQYGWMAQDAPQASTTLSHPRPLGLRLAQVRDLLDAGAIAEGLGLLLQATCVGSQDSLAATGPLLKGFCNLYLGAMDLRSCQVPLLALQEPGGQGGTQQLVMLLATLLHNQAMTELARRTRWLLQWAGADLIEHGQAAQGRLLWAFLLRLCGDVQAEQQLLRQSHHEDAATFWRELQSVYRFTRTLPDVMVALELSFTNQEPSTMMANARQQRVLYFPNYPSNPYLGLLYAPLKRAGAEVAGYLNIGEFLSQPLAPDRDNVLHIHWIHGLVSDIATVGGKQTSIIAALQQRKQLGFRLHWTIHNRLSHECQDERKERNFRQKLYAIADRVYVHHPLATHLLDWLPDDKKIAIHEHGPLEVPDLDAAEITKFRRALGLADSDFVITTIGLMRDYKGLDELLPVLLQMLDANPRIKLVLAGRQSSKKLRDWLKKNPHPQLIVLGEYQHARQIGLLMASSDVGLMTYKAILTSGSLFHWLSAGRTVVAPDMSLIPAHVVDGWNGRLYRNPQHLAAILAHLATMDRAQLSRLHANALHTAKQLHWQPFQ